MRILLIRVKVAGLENVPPEGPLIIMINHINFLDGPIVLATISRDVVAMGKAELFRNPILGPLAWLYGVFPVRRGEADRSALQRAHRVLTEGGAMLLSPEGHRSGHGRLQMAKKGIAFIALRANTVILPVAVSGIEGFWHNIARLRHTDAQVTIGQPFRFVSKGEYTGRQPLREMTTEAMYLLASLLPPRNRGVYRDLSQASQNHLRFLPVSKA